MSKSKFYFSLNALILSISCFICCLFLFANQVAYANDYLVGVFGIPNGDWSILRRAGLNSALISEQEIDKTRNMPIKKIYHLGINPRILREGIDERVLIKRMEHFRSLHDAYNYYIAGDMSCNRKNKVDYYKKLLKINNIAVVCLGEKRSKDIRCYPDYDVMIYHYPLMRTKKSLKQMLQEQADLVRQGQNKTFICVQTHPQFWYRDIVHQNNINKEALIYPDGQVVRMLIYYGIATGGKGYFLYNQRSLSEEDSRERLYAAAQAILETRPLTDGLSKSLGTVFFQTSRNVFGTKISGTGYDLFFVFNGDLKSQYHPITTRVKMNLKEVVGGGNYKAIYNYSPLGSFPISGTIDIPQDHALVLVACKGSVNVESFKLDPASLGLYAEILQVRADKLSANLQLMGMSVPPLKIGSSPLTTRIQTTLKYLDDLNELKRNDWLKRIAGRLPTDGDVINQLYWKKMPIPTQKNQLFNFYYR